MDTSFYSKILLFGEYGIIKNSKGLAIPYNYYKGMLKFKNDKDDPKIKNSNENLRKFLSYLEEVSSSENNFAQFDFHQMKSDIEQGMYFDSSIPQGYGVGSSGALVAALYHRYAINKIPNSHQISQKDMLNLKEIFSKMEAFFHGKSSGLDPLNSYLKKPILINSSDDISPTSIPKSQQGGKGAVFLLDSGMVGETAPMVSIFMEQMKNEEFRNVLKNKFIKYTNQSIDDFLKGNFIAVVKNVKKLSKIALIHFKPMIPKEFHQLWKKGISTGDYFLKLCGSGGGGYILGFTEDFEKAQKSLEGHKIEVVYRF